MSKGRRIGVCIIVAILAMTTIAYPILLYTDNEFISKWRALYIETAMGTMSHQWLATAIIPKDIIDEVMKTRDETNELQKEAASTWGEKDIVEEQQQNVLTEEEQFYALFPELDRASFEAYVEQNKDVLEKGWGKIAIDKTTSSKKTGIVTTSGDNVLAISANQKIMIVEVKGSTYEGKLAIVKDASRVQLKTCAKLYSKGQYVKDIAENNDAILAINASGFVDESGMGNGGTPYGFLKVDGKIYQEPYEHDYKIIGFDENHLLQIGDKSIIDNLPDAIEFGPALIVDGQSMLKNASSGWGLQPRTAIGQTKDKTVLMLVIDGRSTRSVGATIGDCKDILERYGAIQATNLDGGSSSVMYYNGKEITKPTTASNNPHGRMLPNAFVVTWKY